MNLPLRPVDCHTPGQQERLQSFDTFDMPHNLRQIARRSLKQQVIMGIHQTVCVNARIISLRCGLKIFKESLPVPFAFEDRFALISTRSYVIKGTRVCYSQRTGHIRSFINAFTSHLLKMDRILIAYRAIYVKNEDLTPMLFWIFNVISLIMNG